jgi:tRNA 5-methylaminomethyl-2-thiouridine biosynthesis bifunctional protein
VPAEISPARLAFSADGTPMSEAYGDIYHSAEGGLAQARHVFLLGNGLPERWRNRDLFTVLETGFGFGLSFLTTWKAWCEDPARCKRLHFVSIEKHPFAAPDLAILWEKYPELKREGRELLAHWPMLVPGMHRLAFEGGNVVLTLCLGDVADSLPQLQLAADAIYLDGFAPRKNPQMWAPQLLRHLGRLAAPEATLATWSVAALVREALEGAGFAVRKDEGFGPKRDMLRGHLVRTVRTRFVPSARSAIVIGAGIAGAAACERLAARGWRVTLVERHAAPAAEASGNHAGIFHPVVSPDDSLFSRCTRASFLFLLGHWKNLDGLQWERCGVLQMARNAEERASQQRALATLGYPARYAQFDDARGGIWFPEGGWVRPTSLVQGLLSRTKVEKKFGIEVSSLEISGKVWNATDKQGRTIASAPVVILANAADALRLWPQPAVKLRRVRGQLTLVPAITGLEHIVLRGGMALPGIDGVSVVGSSYDVDDEDTELRADSHAGNLERLEQMLPGALEGFNPRLDPAALDGRVAFRAVVPDRLPMIGPLGNGLFAAFAYGSRGLLWASLAGELLAGMLEGEPLPVERKLAAAMDPGRFALRAARRSAGSKG